MLGGGSDSKGSWQDGDSARHNTLSEWLGSTWSALGIHMDRCINISIVSVISLSRKDRTCYTII